ncbi:hypothetical protein HETIRDRAFT_165796 [Heterobasidion irregulare TC 32-1]|uniref:DUF6533 domain-containing protein n=1 Tax=Heterobasidion irregulare (strain TC 32-1) TaxID=747525 RepID=W4KCP6_HETIT|nr:uncharacterized protein HETIRDRAFT_165796 [Heterobasidion irregulare TC 32-1]ETW83514.1 hypothetical protein HETIRDRAFT_165796 [Heterobasidion irregulare TC 32-1]
MSDPASSVFNLRVVGYVEVVSATLLGYEWAILLDQEVSLIWNSPWNLSKILYLLSRYTPVLDMSLSMQHVPCNLRCRNSLYRHRNSNIGTKILSSLGSLWIIWVCVNIWVLVKFMDSLVFADPPSALIPGCYLANGDPIVFVSFASLLFVETVIVILTVYKGFQLTHQSKSPLLLTLYRDGIVFYLCLLRMSFTEYDSIIPAAILMMTSAL